MLLSGKISPQPRHIELTAPVTIAILFLITQALYAEAETPRCFPLESAWQNIQFIESKTEAQKVSTNQHKLAITFNQSRTSNPLFYGFSYPTFDDQKPPQIVDRYSLEEHFRDIDLVVLNRDAAQERSRNHLYRFDPESEGTWIIFLVASLNEIPFLEQRGMRIYPNIEMKRGGTVFGGSSLNLAGHVDYKACLVSNS